MRKIVSIALIVALIVLAIVFIPRLTHTCDDCGKFFVGTGYEPNIVSDFLAGQDQTICKECAENQHALSIAVGKSLDDFKKDLFD